MSGEVVGIDYVGTALPGISETVKLFDTTDAAPGRSFLQMANLRWFKYSIWNSHAGTVNHYYSVDGGTNWRLFATETIAASPTTAATQSTLVEDKTDYKAEFVNGAAAQTVFDITLSLSNET